MGLGMVKQRAILVAVGVFIAHQGHAYAKGAVDSCVDKVDDLSISAVDFELTATDKKAAAAAAKICAKAHSEAPNSPIVRLSLAKSLVWIGETTGALVHLEQLRGSTLDEEAIDLAGALCAYGRGSVRVQDTTCERAQEEGISDPELAQIAGERWTAEGKPEMGLVFFAQSAIGGQPGALDYVNSICSSFDAADPAKALAGKPGLGTIDPYVAAATACEASYESAEENSPAWADYGFKYAELMTHFDSYDVVGGVLSELGASEDDATFEDAVNISDRLCTALAGDPADPDYGSSGVAEVRLVPENALPICETAAFLWPDNGRLHYNLARTYVILGKPYEADADAALEEAVRLGYPLATKLAAPAGVAFDISAFNQPALIRAFYEQDFANLNAEPYYSMVYAKSLNDILGSGDVLFLGDNARFLLLEVDPALSYKAARRIQDPTVFNDVMEKGLQNMWAPFKGIIEARQSGGTIMQEVQGMYEGILQSPQMQAELLASQAQQDAKRLAILYDTNPDDVKKIITGMSAFVEQ